MGKIKSHVEDFLEETGNSLGYNWDNLPELKDFDIIRQHNIPVWEYNGYETEKEYYS